MRDSHRYILTSPTSCTIARKLVTRAGAAVDLAWLHANADEVAKELKSGRLQLHQADRAGRIQARITKVPGLPEESKWRTHSTPYHTAPLDMGGDEVVFTVSTSANVKSEWPKHYPLGDLIPKNGDGTPVVSTIPEALELLRVMGQGDGPVSAHPTATREEVQDIINFYTAAQANKGEPTPPDPAVMREELGSAVVLGDGAFASEAETDIVEHPDTAPRPKHTEEELYTWKTRELVDLCAQYGVVITAGDNTKAKIINKWLAAG